MSDRLIKVADIPNGLWQSKEGLLSLPVDLCSLYREQLELKGLLTVALSATLDEGPVGGMSLEDTKKHFATRFSGSCARVQLAVLDPKDDLQNASDLFLKTFSGGKVGLLDIPCGAGAASASLLTCVAALREQSVLPREPLYVWLLGGDNSDFARAYADECFAKLRPCLEKQAIYLQYKTVFWDVLDADSNTALLHGWMVWARDCQKYFAIAANFSGFLHGANNFDKAKAQLGEVLRWAGELNASVMWLESQKNEVTEGFLPRWLKWFGIRLPKKFIGKASPEDIVGKSEAKCHHPIQSGSQFRVHLSLLRLEAPEA